MWKFSNFSAAQISREINFMDSISSKNCEALNFDYSNFCNFWGQKSDQYLEALELFNWFHVKYEYEWHKNLCLSDILSILGTFLIFDPLWLYLKGMRSHIHKIMSHILRKLIWELKNCKKDLHRQFLLVQSKMFH